MLIARSLFLRLFSTLVVLAVVLTLTGCFKNLVDAEINEQGGGVWTEQMIVDLAKLAEIAQKMGGGEVPGELPTADVEKIKADIEAAVEKVDGVKLSAVDVANTESAYSLKYTLEFTSVDALKAGLTAVYSNAESPLNEGDDLQGQPLSFTKTENGWRLETAMTEGTQGGETDQSMGPMLAQQFGPFFEGIEQRLTLKMPGTEVVDTNAHVTDGTTVTWKVTGPDLIESMRTGDSALMDSMSKMYVETK